MSQKEIIFFEKSNATNFALINFMNSKPVVDGIFQDVNLQDFWMNTCIFMLFHFDDIFKLVV